MKFSQMSSSKPDNWHIAVMGWPGFRFITSLSFLKSRLTYESPNESTFIWTLPPDSLPVEERQGHPAQPSVDRRHHLLAHGPGIPLLGGHHGLAQPVRGGLAAVQQYGVVPTSPGTGNVIWSPAPSTEFTETWEYPRQTLTRRRLKSLSSSLRGHRVSSLKT